MAVKALTACLLNWWYLNEDSGFSDFFCTSLESELKRLLVTRLLHMWQGLCACHGARFFQHLSMQLWRTSQVIYFWMKECQRFSSLMEPAVPATAFRDGFSCGLVLSCGSLLCHLSQSFFILLSPFFSSFLWHFCEQMLEIGHSLIIRHLCPPCTVVSVCCPTLLSTSASVHWFVLI